MTLEVIETSAAMQSRAEAARRAGQRIGFVPTMGYLHDGHLSLLREARDANDLVVLSIYVNPTQFGPNEDLDKYPRDPEGDLLKAVSVGTDLVFMPTQLYPPGYQTYIDVRNVSRGLCGDKRPGHFTGVATVVAKLFHLVKPHVAYFGEKDFQQLAVIRRMVTDLDMDVQIVGMPIVREADGLAMSSRNKYLSPSERQQALALHRALDAAERVVADGHRKAADVLEPVRAALDELRVDYVELRDAETLEPTEGIDRPVLLALAVFVGKTRLIDNRVLRP